MNFKKCVRCGCFFTSKSDVCPNCSPKDHLELSKLKGYLEEINSTSTIHEISLNTGISIKNLNRYLSNNEFKGKLGNLTNTDGNIRIDL